MLHKLSHFLPSRNWMGQQVIPPPPFVLLSSFSPSTQHHPREGFSQVPSRWVLSVRCARRCTTRTALPSGGTFNNKLWMNCCQVADTLIVWHVTLRSAWCASLTTKKRQINLCVLIEITIKSTFLSGKNVNIVITFFLNKRLDIFYQRKWQLNEICVCARARVKMRDQVCVPRL